MEELPKIDIKQHPKDDERWNYFMAGWELGMKDARKIAVRYLSDFVLTEWTPEEVRSKLAKAIELNAEHGQPTIVSECEYENLRKLEYWNQEKV